MLQILSVHVLFSCFVVYFYLAGLFIPKKNVLRVQLTGAVLLLGHGTCSYHLHMRKGHSVLELSNYVSIYVSTKCNY